MTLTQVTTGGVDENINIDSNTLKVDGANNRVGIGTATPSAPLDVVGNDGIAIQSSAQTNEFLIRPSSSSADGIRFTQAGGGGDRMVIDSSGNIGVGLTPTAKLHVSGTIQSQAGSSVAQMYADGGAAYFTSVGAYPMVFQTNGSERMRIDTSGRLLINTTTSASELIIGVGGGLKLSRNNSGSPSSGQSLMSIGFHGVDDTNSNAAAEAKIESSATAHHSGTTAPADLRFYTKPAGTGPGSSPSERLRIDSAGNVSIGRTSALSKLHVSSNNGSADARIGGDAAALGLVLSYDQAGGTVSKITANPTYTNTSSRLHICVDGDANPDQLVLTGNGNCGIGTSSPGVPLHIANQNPSIRLQSNSGSYQGRNTLGQFNNVLYLECDNDNAIANSTIAFTVDAQEAMRIDSQRRVLIGRTTATDQSTISGDVDLVVQGTTLSKHGYLTNVGTSYTTIPGANLGNETSVYLVSISGNGTGNFHSSAVYLLTSGAYAKTFTQLGSAAGHFGNGVVQAQLSSYSGTSSSVQVKRSTSGTCTVEVNMLRLT